MSMLECFRCRLTARLLEHPRILRLPFQLVLPLFCAFGPRQMPQTRPRGSRAVIPHPTAAPAHRRLWATLARIDHIGWTM